ncbi:MAG TPA: DUF6782 family putative metallopeptidase, partial [Chloroflexota bacterium]|nr:DUF6782 family putative metallopeptidase [Chloroflexota bacterium]
PCAEPLRAALSAVLYDAPGGRPLATTNTTSVTLVPGETQPARVSAESRRDRLSAERAEQGMPPLPMAPQASPTPPKPPIVAGWVAPLLSAGPPPPEGQREERQFPFDLGFEFEAGAGAARPAPTPPAEVCLDVAARGCLHVDPRLRQTVEVLRGVEMGASLLAEAADFGVTVRRAALFGNLGQYENRSRTITIAASLDELSDWERAAVLAHELQHVHDHLRGLLPTSTQSECVARERAAFGREARFWRELWQGQLPDARDSVQDSLNRSVSEAEDDPQAYARSLARLYRHQCDR